MYEPLRMSVRCEGNSHKVPNVPSTVSLTPSVSNVSSLTLTDAFRRFYADYTVSSF